MIGIVDYGIGNIRSLRNGLEATEKASVTFVTTPEEIQECDKIILPGVGAFRPAIERIKERGLDRPIYDKANHGHPVLGICHKSDDQDRAP